MCMCNLGIFVLSFYFFSRMQISVLLMIAVIIGSNPATMLIWLTLKECTKNNNYLLIFSSLFQQYFRQTTILFVLLSSARTVF